MQSVFSHTEVFLTWTGTSVVVESGLDKELCFLVVRVLLLLRPRSEPDTTHKCSVSFSQVNAISEISPGGISSLD